ncbi:MAG: hypothetical protein QOE59_2511 [Actinomycetota bacterium]|jgi:hypothetical protein|nr:hypothetical protein [Actinomycetota bacterium]
MRRSLGQAFSRPDALRCALGVYRALPETGRLLVEATRGRRVRVPTVAVGAALVGRALEQQLRPVTDGVEGT